MREDDAVLVTILTTPEDRDEELAESEFERASELADGGYIEEALRIFRTLVEDFPEVSLYRRNLAQGYLMTGEPEKAEDELLRALALDPYDALSVTILANTRMQQGRVKDAVSLYEKSLEIGRNVYSLYNLGVAHVRLGNLPKAVDLLEQAILEDPTYAPAMDALMRLKGKQ